MQINIYLAIPPKLSAPPSTASPLSSSSVIREQNLGELRALAEENQISEGENEGEPVFFKECRDKKLLSSIAFDVGNFATMAANVLLSAYMDEPEEKETRFVTETRTFLSRIIAPDPKRNLYFNAHVPGVPNVKFSAVVSNTSKMSIVSCVNGTSFNDFRKNTLDAAFNLKLAWRSNARTQLDKTVPILNDNARGYDPDKLADRIKELTDQAKMEPVLWSQKEKLRTLLAA